MPLCRIETNVTFDEHVKTDLCAKLSQTLATLTGKSENYVMTLIVDNVAMSFAGSLEPAASVECKSIGLAETQCTQFCSALCAFIDQEMGVSPDRTYIEFTDLNRRFFGWNGSTFG
ncbi:phenylpyruvate tautomerase MIF-related protein [Desulfovibrio inopinatus]|uniref:phenylpyruvate tautomerase MIF-related protein n=1 Tax=Desulfovibrio inopinatus TaxID=102109 RepID=UPI0003F7E0CD|nr:phenylpyruvate tautomerase MIF-related protein [Desulfovibrio inopinatus]